jgi:hypothetical protein
MTTMTAAERALRRDGTVTPLGGVAGLVLAAVFACLEPALGALLVSLAGTALTLGGAWVAHTVNFQLAGRLARRTNENENENENEN